jgi:DNA-binding NtrC family response regulator
VHSEKDHFQKVVPIERYKSHTGSRKDERIDCVFLTDSRSEAAMATRMVASCGIRIHHASSLRQARLFLAISRATVLLVKARFDGGDWREALQLLARNRLPAVLVVAIPEFDGGLWVEALREGACDVIPQPFRADELIRVIESASECATRTEARRALSSPPDTLVESLDGADRTESS